MNVGSEYLLDLVFNPLVWLSVIAAVLTIAHLYSHPTSRLKWVAVTIFIFLASLKKYNNPLAPPSPDLVFPLEALRNFGRIGTIAALGLLVVLSFIPVRQWRRINVPKALLYISIFKLVITVKTMFYGSLNEALALLLILLATIMAHTAMSRWLVTTKDFDHAMLALANVVTIFVCINVYQIAIDPYPVTFWHGWFLGTTGNPHHAAQLLGGVIPVYLYLIFKSENSLGSTKRGFLSLMLALSALGLVWTSSRNSILAATISLLYFFRNKLGKILKLAFILSALFLLYQMLFEHSFNIQDLFAPLQEKVLKGENTRSEAFDLMWVHFMQNPIFGSPIEGNRALFLDSSWLSALDTAGLAGFVPMLMFLFAVVSMSLQLYRISGTDRSLHLMADAVVSGMIFYMIASIFEAFLNGNMTDRINIVYLYISLGLFIIDEARRRRYSATGHATKLK